MSATVACPACQQPTPIGSRPGSAVRCRSCSHIFKPGGMPAPTASSAAQNISTLVGDAFGRSPPVFPTATPFDSVKPPALTTRTSPEVANPSNAPVIIGVIAFLGVMILFCGGVATLIVMSARDRIVASTQKVQDENVRRQPEFNFPKQNLQPKVKLQPMPGEPFDFTPPKIPSPPPPIIPPPTIARPMKPNERQTVQRPSVTSAARLDEIITALEDTTNQRSPVFLLHELQRLPLQAERRADVSVAIEPHLHAADLGTVQAALRAAQVWGTDWNVPALIELIDSPQLGIRWEAICTLPKLSRTPETADLLAAKIGDLANLGPLRDAFKEWGAVGETAILKRLEAGDKQTKNMALMLLTDVGSEAAKPALEKMAASEADFGLKSQAQQALRRIAERPK